MEEKREWCELSEAEVNKFKRKQCVKCYYYSQTTKKDRSSVSICNYSAITGKNRLCSPLECKEKGFYEELNGRRRPKINNAIRISRVEYETEKEDMGILWY